MAGFGREPFGHGPFGKSNYGKDTTVRVFPKSSLEKDKDNKLLNYLLTVENSANFRREEIDEMISLVNPDEIRQDILFHLGEMIGVTLDSNEPEEFQRTLVRDAVQYYRLKATNKSYSIRGLISGFDVEVVRIWQFDGMYLPFIPEKNRYEYPPGSGSVSGIWYTDLSPDMVSGGGVSATVPINGDCTYCLTAFVKINYTLKKIPTEAIVGNLLDRVVAKIKDVVPIHVRDLFIDLTITIETDPLNPGVELFINENAEIISPFVDRYDIIEADSIETDRHIPSITFG